MSRHQVKDTSSALGGKHKQRRKIKIDSETSGDSDSDDLCSTNISTTIGSVEAQSKYRGKENIPSPVWLSARTKLQKFAFHKQDANIEASSGDTNSKQENVQSLCGSCDNTNAPLLIIDSESSPQIPSLVLPNASSCSSGPPSPQTAPPPPPSTNDESLDSTEEEGSCLTDSEDDFSDKQKEAILKFLNGSSEGELCEIPGCSLTKAKLLVQHLPLDKWEHLVSGRLP